LLRDCPIDHPCMTRVSSARVSQVAKELLCCSTPRPQQESSPASPA
jgi:hypothetical protein